MCFAGLIELATNTLVPGCKHFNMPVAKRRARYSLDIETSRCVGLRAQLPGAVRWFHDNGGGFNAPPICIANLAGELYARIASNNRERYKAR